MLALIEKKTRNVICEFNSDHIIQAESIQEMTEKVIHWKQCMFLISKMSKEYSKDNFPISKCFTH